MRRLGFIAIAIALVLAGCSSGTVTNATNPPTTNNQQPTGEKKLVVGFSQIGAESAWRTAETGSIQDEAKARGIDLKFSDAQGDQTKQIAALHSFITQHVDAIILAPKVEEGWDQVLKEAKDANIPVILVDRGVKVSDDSLYTTLIASDFVSEGQRAAAQLVLLLDKKTGSMNRPKNIVEIEGTTGSAPAIDRKKGFDDEIQKNPAFKIIASQSGDFQRTKGKEVMEAFLKSNPQIDAVYAHNDDMAIGAIQAIEEAGKKPGVDTLVVSIDGIKDALTAIKDGKENVVIECNPLLGPAAFDAVKKAVKGEKMEKKTTVQDQQFDASNVAAALPARKY
jgi:ABC-type sugar transport system substrate-binding protein